MPPFVIFAARVWRFERSRRIALFAAAVLANVTCLPSSLAQSLPSIGPGGVVNAASYMPADRPAGAIARGSIFSIFGTDLGPAEGIATTQLPLTTELGGIRVAVFSSDGQRFDAYPLFVSDGQINALLPSEVPAGHYFVQMEFAGGQSNAIPIKVVDASFGLFGRPLSTSDTVPSRPTGPRVAVAQNFRAEGRLDLNAPETAARPGQVIVLWGTGLGPINAPDSEAPPAEDVDTPVEVLIGGKPAGILYQGRSPCCPGVDQINLRIPSDAPPGCAVPASVRVHGAIYSNVETISIGRDGRGCSDSATIPGGRRGQISLYRTVSAGETTDSAQASFLDTSERRVFRPPSGSCIRTGATGLAAFGLDAGSQIMLYGPQTSVALSGGPPIYSALSPPGPLFLGPGHFTASASGGTGPVAVGPFEAELTAGDPVEWSEPPNSTSASRDGISLSWNEATTNRAIIVSIPAAGSTSAGFNCAVPEGATAFDIPPAILANIPNRELPLQLSQRWAPEGSEFTATGLDSGDFDYTHNEVRTLVLPPAELPSTPVTLPNGHTIQAELAASFEERASGLMNRPELAESRGMLFLFDSAGIYPFWMYRTLVPLDIIWLDEDRKIVSISADTPPCNSENSSQCQNYFPSGVSRYVLEISGGQAAANRLAAGSELQW